MDIEIKTMDNNNKPDIIAVFRALSDPTRFAVYQCIRCCGGACSYNEDRGECCGSNDDNDGVTACRIRCTVPCSPSTLSHHLNELRAAGLITTERHGRVIKCRIHTEALAQIGAFVAGK